MKKILFNIIILLALCGCGDGKREFVKEEFESTVDKAFETNNPLLIEAYIVSANIPDIEKANAYGQMGLIFIKKNDEEKTIIYLNKALTIAQSQSGELAALIRRVALYELAGVYVKNKKLHKAKDAYELLLKDKLRYPSLKLNTIKIYQELAFIGQDLKDYALMYKMSMNILLLQKKSSQITPERIAATCIMLSRACYGLKKYNESINWGKQALAFFNKEKNVDLFRLAHAYFNIANSYHGQGNYTEAIEYMKKASAAFLKTRGRKSDNYLLATSKLNQWQQKQ